MATLSETEPWPMGRASSLLAVKPVVCASIFEARRAAQRYVALSEKSELGGGVADDRNYKELRHRLQQIITTNPSPSLPHGPRYPAVVLYEVRVQREGRRYEPLHECVSQDSQSFHYFVKECLDIPRLFGEPLSLDGSTQAYYWTGSQSTRLRPTPTSRSCMPMQNRQPPCAAPCVVIGAKETHE